MHGIHKISGYSYRGFHYGKAIGAKTGLCSDLLALAYPITTVRSVGLAGTHAGLSRELPSRIIHDPSTAKVLDG